LNETSSFNWTSPWGLDPGYSVEVYTEAKPLHKLHQSFENAKKRKKAYVEYRWMVRQDLGRQIQVSQTSEHQKTSRICQEIWVDNTAPLVSSLIVWLGAPHVALRRWRGIEQEMSEIPKSTFQMWESTKVAHQNRRIRADLSFLAYKGFMTYWTENYTVSCQHVRTAIKASRDTKTRWFYGSMVPIFCYFWHESRLPSYVWKSIHGNMCMGMYRKAL